MFSVVKEAVFVKGVSVRARTQETARGKKTPEGAHKVAAVGAAIRALRGQRGLSLRDLSRLTGLSIGFLSLVERGQSSLALTSLYKVATALDSDVVNFFQPNGGIPEEHPPPHVTRADESTEISIAGSNRTYRLLSDRGHDRVLEPLHVTVQPTETVEEPSSHMGEEFAYVLSGELLYMVAGTQYRLGPGDSIYFPAIVPHAIHNDTGEPAHVLWVLTLRLI
jgi:transcriptional regulator with XRE-family HTH domain